MASCFQRANGTYMDYYPRMEDAVAGTRAFYEGKGYRTIPWSLSSCPEGSVQNPFLPLSVESTKDRNSDYSSAEATTRSRGGLPVEVLQPPMPRLRLAQSNIRPAGNSRRPS